MSQTGLATRAVFRMLAATYIIISKHGTYRNNFFFYFSRLVVGAGVEECTLRVPTSSPFEVWTCFEIKSPTGLLVVKFNMGYPKCSGGACMEARVGTCLTKNFTPSQV